MREFLTASKIQSDFCALAHNIYFTWEGESKTLAGLVDGGVYQQGYRPRGSGKEDIVVTHTAGLANRDLVHGEVTINIFIPDVQYQNGVYLANPQRVPLLERALQEWVKALDLNHTDYLISLLDPVKNVEDSVAKEHFVVAHLRYEYCLTY